MQSLEPFKMIHLLFVIKLKKYKRYTVQLFFQRIKKKIRLFLPQTSAQLFLTAKDRRKIQFEELTYRFFRFPGSSIRPSIKVYILMFFGNDRTFSMDKKIGAQSWIRFI